MGGMGQWRDGGMEGIPLPLENLFILPPLSNNFHVIFQQKLIFSCSHCSFILFVLTGHANFDFNQCSIFTECCFQFWKRLEWSKSLLFRFPPPDKKFPQQNFPFPHPLRLFGKLCYSNTRLLCWINLKWTLNRGVFRTHSNIYDAAFLRIKLTANYLKLLTIFAKKLHRRCSTGF